MTPCVTLFRLTMPHHNGKFMQMYECELETIRINLKPDTKNDQWFDIPVIK